MRTKTPNTRQCSSSVHAWKISQVQGDLVDVQITDSIVLRFVGVIVWLVPQVPAYKILNKEGSMNMCRSLASQKLVLDLMVLLESLLIEYFGHEWDNVDGMLKANEGDLQESGMLCLWEPNLARVSSQDANTG